MRLPANRREWLELLLRGTAVVLIAVLGFRALFPAQARTGSDLIVARVADLPSLSRQSTPARIQFALDGIPTAVQRAWQNALKSAGSGVSWSGTANPVAIVARPVASPQGGYTLTAYSPDTTRLILRDNISTVDSMSMKGQPRSVVVPMASGNVRAVVGTDSAFARLSDSVIIGKILVIGKAGWESKFVMTALEEAGWKIDAIISVAPNVAVAQGSVTTIDTAHYAAVIALDESAATRATAIASFVKSGGGLVLSDLAARSGAFASLRVSAPGGAPHTSISSDTITHAEAAFSPILPSGNSVPLEERGGNVAVAAKRVDFGRVVQLGFNDTWKWRMQGGAESVSEHRTWWSNTLSQAVRSRRVTVDYAQSDPSPYTNLIDIAGHPVAPASPSQPLSQHSNEMLWLTVIGVLLFGEWASRRLRGAG